MLSAKSILVAAAAAFAFAQVAAADSTHVKVHLHHAKHHHEACPAGEREVSVEGVEGVFCAKDQICAGVHGNCPGKQDGLPYGSRCDKVVTGVLGCVENEEHYEEEEEADSDECGEDESPMSVEGVEGVFCVSGQACVADIKDGACPGKQEGLPYGSYCGKVKTGVYGCKPSAAPAKKSAHKKTHAKQAAPCKAGYREVSVEGVPGVFCAKDQLCAGVWGNCPTESSAGLPYGAYCGEVRTGVLGCKPKAKWMAHKSFGKQAAPCKAGYREVSVEGVAGVYCAKDQICAGVWGNCPTESSAGLPYGAYCGEVRTGVLGCKPKTKWMAHKSAHAKHHHEACPAGEREVSVEGVEGVFCAKDQICAGVHGNCPGKQDGLPYGSRCDKVVTGVLGCVENEEHYEEEEEADSDECGEDESPMSVEGVEGVFCVSGQACVADIKDGACPGKQEGLPYGSYCGKVKTGVYGCKPSAAPAKKSAHKKH